MIKPVRLRLSRKRNFNLQAASEAVNGLPAVFVARPSKWGNPLIVGKYGTAAECTRGYAMICQGYWPVTAVDYATAERIHGFAADGFPELRGKNIACWCSLSAPCHGDILLELANKP